MTIFLFILIAVIGYLIGSLSASIILSKLISGEDVRDSGSGNAGATNMVRKYGSKIGVLTYFLDFLKVIIAYGIVYLMVHLLKPDLIDNYLYFIKAVVGFFCLFGHMYPVFFGFKGGKGISVCSGVLCIVWWPMFLINCTTYLLILYFTKYSSLASLVYAVMYPVFTFILVMFTSKEPFVSSIPSRIGAVVIAIAFAFILIWNHKENIRRLFKGEESKIDLFKKDKKKE